MRLRCISSLMFFFFNDTATTEIYTLSLHDALPIYNCCISFHFYTGTHSCQLINIFESIFKNTLCNNTGSLSQGQQGCKDRKSTRLNSSHANISYAVFCLKKKKIIAHSYHTSLKSHT